MEQNAISQQAMKDVAVCESQGFITAFTTVIV